MRKQSRTILNLVFVLVPVAVYFRAWDYYAINIPKWDDHQQKRFLVDYFNARTFSEKWTALSAQLNEHRILLTHLTDLLDYQIFGVLNFKHLMFFGNIILVLALGLWWVVLRDNKKSLITLVPVAFLWFTLAHWENMYWGMAAVQNFGVVGLSVAAFYLATSAGKWKFAASVLLGVLAIFTSGNGLLALPIITGLLFLMRQPRRAIASIMVFSISVWLYFGSYVQPLYNPVAQIGVLGLIKGYMAFIGSFAEALPVRRHQDICVALGGFLFIVSLIIISASIFRLLRNQYEDLAQRRLELLCLASLLFVLATAAIVVYSRAGFGVEKLITSRFKIYSLLTLITVYLFIVVPIKGSFLTPYLSCIILLAVLYNIFSYHYHLVDAYSLRRFLTTSLFNEEYQTKQLTKSRDSTPVGRLVEKPMLFFDSWPTLIKDAQNDDTGISARAAKKVSDATSAKAQAASILVRNNSFRSQRVLDSGVYILLSSINRYYLFPTYRERNNNRKELFLRQKYFADGFHADLHFSEMIPDTYRLGVALLEGDSVSIFMRPDSILVKKAEPMTQIKTNW